jgi:site-specific DNA recombinase
MPRFKSLLQHENVMFYQTKKKENMKGIKFFLYARKSTEDEERQVMSIEAQLSELEQFAKREHIKITERFIENKSAKTPGRLQFNEMVDKIHASKEPIGILAWHPDRLARNSVDGGQIIYLIDIKKIAALRFPTFWFEPTPQGLFMLQVAFGQSKYYSDNLSENVKRGMRQKLRRGEWLNLAPVGYVNNPKTRNIEPDPIKAKIIQAIYKEFAAGNHSLESARHRLSFFGLVSRSGKVLGKAAVQRILTNPVYTGRIIHKGESYLGNFEPLIGNELFEAVQEQLKQRSRPRKSRNKHDFPFTGLFTCGECGGAITAQYGKGNGGIYVYYRCSKKHGKCYQPYLREELMIEQIQGQLQKVSLPDGWASAVFAQLERWEEEEQEKLHSFAQTLAKDLSLTQRKLDNLVNGFLDSIIDKETYVTKKDELIRKKIELEHRQSRFGQRAKLWVEPMRDWLETAHKAGKLALSNDHHEMKQMMEKIGTNRQVKDKEVGVDLQRPFDILLKFKALQNDSEEYLEEKRKGRTSDIPERPVMSG